MITTFYSMVTLLMTLVYLWLFDAYRLDFPAPLFWLASLLLGLLSGFVALFLLMACYGRFQKGDQTKNMRNHRFVMSLMHFVMRVLRAKIIVSGTENIPDEPFVMVSNHQTNFDIIAIKPLIKNQPMIFIAKHSLFKWPVIGHLVKLLGNISIYRLSDRSAIKSILAGIKQYENGVPVSIFPEGTRSHGNEMIDFKAGAFKLATKPKAPILVVSIYNFCSLLKYWPIKRHNVYIHIHPVISPDEYEDMNTQALSKHVKAIIQSQLDRFEKIEHGQS